MHMYLNQSGGIDLLEHKWRSFVGGKKEKGKEKEKEKNGFCSSVHMLCTDHVGEGENFPPTKFSPSLPNLMNPPAFTVSPSRRAMYPYNTYIYRLHAALSVSTYVVNTAEDGGAGWW